MKSKIKRISLVVIISSLLASIAAVFSVFIVNTESKVKVESSNDELSLDKYLLEKKNILSLIKNKNNDIVFDELAIKANLRKTILNVISQTSYYKMNNFKINDINLKIKYSLKSEKELVLNLSYNFAKLNKEYKPFFILEIY